MNYKKTWNSNKVKKTAWRKVTHCLCSLLGTFTLVSSGPIPETDCGSSKLWVGSGRVQKNWPASNSYMRKNQFFL